MLKRNKFLVMSLMLLSITLFTTHSTFAVDKWPEDYEGFEFEVVVDAGKYLIVNVAKVYDLTGGKPPTNTASASSSILISGTLIPDEYHLWELGYLLWGSLVTVYLYWSPSAATVELALYCPPHKYDPRVVVDGSTVQSWTVPWSGNWYFYIRNISTMTVTYDGYIKIVYASSLSTEV